MTHRYSADNGGRGDGINWPLRGEKRTNYEGGMRVSAFVSGGVIPPPLKGTSSNIRFHIVDWCGDRF
jgi:arylsulfatase A-like enzyme